MLGGNFLQKLSQNFGDKTAIPIDGPDAHGLRGIAANGAMRLPQLHTRQKRRPPVQVVGHRAQPWGNDPANICPVWRDNVESDCRAKVHHD